MINWQALGEPRIDGSDTAPIVQAKALAARTEPFSLQAVERVLNFVPKNKPYLVPDPNGIPKGSNALLQVWPEIARTAEDMLVAVYPCLDSRNWRVPPIGGAYGCKGEGAGDFGHVYASTNSAMGFVEGIVSSLANWKLYGAGINYEWWPSSAPRMWRANDHPHVLRPQEGTSAGGVIHMTYCCAHLLVYYQYLLKLNPVPDGALYQAQKFYGRIGRGVRTVRTMIMPIAPADFTVFLETMCSWVERLLARPVEGL